MFGVLTRHLARLVNHGHSFETAEDLFNLLSEFPLRHTYFHLFKPERNRLPIPKPDSAELSNFYLVEYDRDKGIVTGKYHSQIGTKIRFVVDKDQGLKRSDRLRESIFDSINFLCSFLFSLTHMSFLVWPISKLS